LLVGLIAVVTLAGAVLLLAPDARGPMAALLDDASIDRDLDAIRADTLRVLVMDHHLVYQRVGPVETGLEFELIERFARRERLYLKAVPVQWPDSLLPWLARGVGDVVAVGLNGRSPIARKMATTLPYRFVSPVLVTLRRDPLCAAAVEEQPDADSAWVSMWSPFAAAERRSPADATPGPDGRVLFTDTSRYGDASVVNVALGRVRAALVSDAAANFFVGRMPQLRVSGPLNGSVPLVFATRRNARDLLHRLDAHLAEPAEKEAVAMLISAYGSAPTAEEDRPMPGCASTSAAFDAITLASILFRSAEPSTSVARPLGAGAGAQLTAAAHYLEELDTTWRRSVPDPRERLYFVAASYVAGAGHVMDAQALAGSMGLDTQRWTCSVERALSLLDIPRYFASPVVSHGLCAGGKALRRVREVVCAYANTAAAVGVPPGQ
jgi:membrane-bound lytic murein transglycosylase MltF